MAKEFALLDRTQKRNRFLHRYVQQGQYQIGARHFARYPGQPTNHTITPGSSVRKPLNNSGFWSVWAMFRDLLVDLLRCVKAMALSVLFKFP